MISTVRQAPPDPTHTSAPRVTVMQAGEVSEDRGEIRPSRRTGPAVALRRRSADARLAAFPPIARMVATPAVGVRAARTGARKLCTPRLLPIHPRCPGDLLERAAIKAHNVAKHRGHSFRFERAASDDDLGQEPAARAGGKARRQALAQASASGLARLGRASRRNKERQGHHVRRGQIASGSNGCQYSPRSGAEVASGAVMVHISPDWPTRLCICPTRPAGAITLTAPSPAVSRALKPCAVFSY